MKLDQRVMGRGSWAAFFVSALLLTLIVAFFALSLIAAPFGFTLRLLIVLLLAGVIFFAWAFRSSRNAHPGQFFGWMTLLVVFFSVAWPRYVFFSVGGPSINPQTASLLVALALGLFWLLFSPAFGAQIAVVFRYGGPIGVLILVWLGWRLLACLLGEYPIAATFGYLRDVVFLSSFFLIGLMISSRDEWRTQFLRLVVFAGLLVSFAGVVEAFQQKNVFVGFASGADTREASEAIAGIAMEKVRLGAFRAQSVFDHPIVFAQFVAAMLPVAWFLLLRDRSVLWRLIALAAMPLGLIAILKAGSRAGYISIGVAVMFGAAMLWLRGIAHGKVGKAVAIAAVPALVAGFFLAYFAAQEIALGRGQHEVSSTAVRLYMLRTGIEALWDSPVYGFGHGMALVKAGVIGAAGLPTIDNYLLSIALDSGYVGLVLLLAVVFVYALKGIQAAVVLKGQDGLEVAMLVASVLALFTAFAGLSIANNMSLFWLLIAATFPLLRSAELSIRKVSA